MSEFIGIFLAVLLAILIAPHAQKHAERIWASVSRIKFVQHNGVFISTYLIVAVVTWTLVMIILPQLYMVDFSFRHNLLPNEIGGPKDTYTLEHYSYRDLADQVEIGRQPRDRTVESARDERVVAHVAEAHVEPAGLVVGAVRSAGHLAPAAALAAPRHPRLEVELAVRRCAQVAGTHVDHPVGNLQRAEDLLLDRDRFRRRHRPRGPAPCSTTTPRPES